MRQHLHIITLGVQDLKTSKRFYSETLGWKISRPQEGIAFFQTGGVVLALFPREELAKDALVDSKGHDSAGFTLAYNARSESEVDEIINELRSKGVKIVKEPQKVFGVDTVPILRTQTTIAGKSPIIHFSPLMKTAISNSTEKMRSSRGLFRLNFISNIPKEL